MPPLRFHPQILSQRLFLLLPLVFVLSACALSPAQRSAADQHVRAHPGLLADRPAEEPQASRLPHVEEGHHLILVDRGDDALALRLELIRSARSSIEVQNYISLLDDSGRLLLAELLAAAQRGVRVRLLLDSLFSLPDPDVLAALELAHPNFELRLYRPVLNRAVLSDAGFIGAMICCFFELNQRMHNKLITVDDRHGLVGGRNHSARYFDLDPRMVFVDLEVLVSGPVADTMRLGFDRFWAEAPALAPRHTRDVHPRLATASASSLVMDHSERIQRLLKEFADGAWLDRLLLEHSFRVGAVDYFNDLPADRPDGVRSGSGDSTARIHAVIAAAEHSVVIQTPYVVLTPRFERVLAGLSPEVEVRISSNSLASTDAFPVYAISRRQRARLLEQLGVHLFEAKPFPKDPQAFIPRYPALIEERAAGWATPMRGDPRPATREMPGPRLSQHAKLVVVDGHISVVTSHNLDPRSAFYNTENGIIVRDPAFAAALLRFVDAIAAPDSSWASAMQPPLPAAPLEALDRLASRASRRLPVFDLWPRYRFDQYRIPDEETLLLLGSAAFFESAEPVGLAPEVVAWQRRWVTAWISRMMGFIHPIL